MKRRKKNNYCHVRFLNLNEQKTDKVYGNLLKLLEHQRLLTVEANSIRRTFWIKLLK